MKPKKKKALTLDELLLHEDNKLLVRESDRLEFKANFDWENKTSRAKYCRTMAAFCNNSGGYLFFGVQNKTGAILGITNFNTVDPVEIANYLKAHFAPSFTFQTATKKVAGKEIGIISVDKRTDTPIVCIKQAPDMDDGDIYMRYAASTEQIRGNDLIQLINEIKGSNYKIFAEYIMAEIRQISGAGTTSNLVTQEMLEIEKKKLKLSALPRLISNSGMSSGYHFSVAILNEGKRAIITNIKLEEGRANLIQAITYPFTVNENASFSLNLASPVGLPPVAAIYKVQIFYDDVIGTHYMVEGEGRGPTLKLGSPEELK